MPVQTREHGNSEIMHGTAHDLYSQAVGEHTVETSPAEIILRVRDVRLAACAAPQISARWALKRVPRHGNPQNIQAPFPSPVGKGSLFFPHAYATPFHNNVWPLPKKRRASRLRQACSRGKRRAQHRLLGEPKTWCGFEG